MLSRKTDKTVAISLRVVHLQLRGQLLIRPGLTARLRQDAHRLVEFSVNDILFAATGSPDLIVAPFLLLDHLSTIQQSAHQFTSAQIKKDWTRTGKCTEVMEGSISQVQPWLYGTGFGGGEPMMIMLRCLRLVIILQMEFVVEKDLRQARTVTAVPSIDEILLVWQSGVVFKVTIMIIQNQALLVVGRVPNGKGLRYDRP